MCIRDRDITEVGEVAIDAVEQDAVDAIEVTEAELRRIWADEAGREPDAFDVEAAFDALDDLLEAGYELRPPEQQAGFGEVGEAA